MELGFYILNILNFDSSLDGSRWSDLHIVLFYRVWWICSHLFFFLCVCESPSATRQFSLQLQIPLNITHQCVRMTLCTYYYYIYIYTYVCIYTHVYVYIYMYQLTDEFPTVTNHLFVHTILLRHAPLFLLMRTVEQDVDFKVPAVLNCGCCW